MSKVVTLKQLRKIVKRDRSFLPYFSRTFYLIILLKKIHATDTDDKI